MKTILSTAYWPNLNYFYYVFNSDSVFIEQFDNYHKQSFRNRTQILSANGPLNLSIPVNKNQSKELTKNIEISYEEHWQIKHWRAIISAYKNSPYFEHFESEIEHLYTKKHELLLEYNQFQLQTVFKILKLKKEISHTLVYQKEMPGVLDLRNVIHPKKDYRKDSLALQSLSKPYYQTFENKFKFVPNLSILDLLFNKGLDTINYFNDNRTAKKV